MATLVSLLTGDCRRKLQNAMGKVAASAALGVDFSAITQHATVDVNQVDLVQLQRLVPQLVPCARTEYWAVWRSVASARCRGSQVERGEWPPIALPLYNTQRKEVTVQLHSVVAKSKRPLKYNKELKCNVNMPDEWLCRFPACGPVRDCYTYLISVLQGPGLVDTGARECMSNSVLYVLFALDPIAGGWVLYAGKADGNGGVASRWRFSERGKGHLSQAFSVVKGSGATDVSVVDTLLALLHLGKTPYVDETTQKRTAVLFCFPSKHFSSEHDLLVFCTQSCPFKRRTWCLNQINGTGGSKGGKHCHILVKLTKACVKVIVDKALTECVSRTTLPTTPPVTKRELEKVVRDVRRLQRKPEYDEWTVGKKRTAVCRVVQDLFRHAGGRYAVVDVPVRLVT